MSVAQTAKSTSVDAFTAEVIRSTVETPRRLVMEPASLRELRLKVEKHIKNTYLKQVQAPVGVRPVLKCWMELN